MAAPIDLQQHPLLGIPLPSAAVLGSSAATGTPDTPPRQQDPSHGRPRQTDASRSTSISVRWVWLSPDYTPLANSLTRSCTALAVVVGGFLPLVSVSHSSCSIPSVCCQQSPRMALAHFHQSCRLQHLHLTLQNPVQHLYSRLLSVCQPQSFHRLRFSVNT